MKAFGAPSEVLDAASEQAAPKEFEVLEENWTSVLMFIRLRTQWIVSTGGVVGLNYQSAEFLFKIFNVEDHAKVFDDLQVMEFASLEILRSKG